MRQGCPDNYALIACQDCIFLPRMNQIRFIVTEGQFWTHSYWTVIMFALFFQVKYQSYITVYQLCWLSQKEGHLSLQDQDVVTSCCSDNCSNKNWDHVCLWSIYKSFIGMTRLTVNQPATWILCNMNGWGCPFLFCFTNLQPSFFFYEMMPKICLFSCLHDFLKFHSANIAHGKSITLKTTVITLSRLFCSSVAMSRTFCLTWK